MCFWVIIFVKEINFEKFLMNENVYLQECIAIYLFQHVGQKFTF
jgi:hypothetical protein